jgi:hypothetical protein
VGLRAVLVDEARARRPVGQPERVDGTTITSPATLEWVRVRVDLGAGPRERPADQAPRTRRSPSLMCLPDPAGECPFRPPDVVEVRSAQLGRFRMKVTGAATPIRKKRRVIGWTVPLERVVEATQEQAIA